MNRLAGSSVDGGHGESKRRDDEFALAEGSTRRGAPWRTPLLSFGQRLKAQRERRGIPLEVIAESYKISRSLLADLERDDLSKWPHGVFGRGFVRAYATAIGLAPGPIVSEFVSLCPDDGDIVDPPAVAGADSDLRLTLAGDGRAALATAAARIAAAAVEAGLVIGAGFLASPVTTQSGWALAGAIALVYYPSAAACLGRVPSQWWLERRRMRAQRNADNRIEFSPRRPLQLIISRPDRPDSEFHEPSDA